VSNFFPMDEKLSHTVYDVFSGSLHEVIDEHLSNEGADSFCMESCRKCLELLLKHCHLPRSLGRFQHQSGSSTSDEADVCFYRVYYSSCARLYDWMSVNCPGCASRRTFFLICCGGSCVPLPSWE